MKDRSMFQKIMRQLQRRGERLLAGRYADCAGEFRFPLPVYLEDQMIVLQNAGQMADVLERVHAALKAKGVSQLVADVTAVSLPKNGCIRVWAGWEEFGRGPGDYRTSEVVYFGRMTEKGFVAEMVEYTRLSMPEFRALPPVMAVSA